MKTLGDNPEIPNESPQGDPNGAQGSQNIDGQEKDSIGHPFVEQALLKNSQLAQEILQRSQATQEAWTPVNDDLSADQAKESAESIRADICSYLEEIDRYQSQAEANLKSAFSQESSVGPSSDENVKIERDIFETTEEYEKRVREHQRRLAEAEADTLDRITEMSRKERIRLAELKLQALEIKLELLRPFLDRLEKLQSMVFFVPVVEDNDEVEDPSLVRRLHKWFFESHEAEHETPETTDKYEVEIKLGAPDSDKSRFPLEFRYQGEVYESHWTYRDREKARLLYETREDLKAQPIFQLEPRDENKAGFVFAGARGYHSSANLKKDLLVSSPRPFPEMDLIREIESTIPPVSYFANHRVTWIEVDRDRNFIAYDNGIIEDARTGLEWFVGADEDMNWNDATTWATSLSLAAGGWRIPKRTELATLLEQGRGSRNMSPLFTTTGWHVWSSDTKGERYLFACRYRFSDGSGPREEWRAPKGSRNNRVFAVRKRR